MRPLKAYMAKLLCPEIVFFFVLILTIVGISSVSCVYALSDKYKAKFSQNNIMFYDPEEQKSANCLPSGGSGGGTGVFPAQKYNLSDDELCRIAAAATHENNCSLESFKDEVSLMANHADKDGSFANTFAGTWFAGVTKDAYNNGDFASGSCSDYLEATRDIVNNGNRTIPTQIVEHDCFTDECGAGVYAISNGGSTTPISSHKDAESKKDQFKQGSTVMLQDDVVGGGRWIFYKFAGNDTNCDPMGYLESDPPTSTPTYGDNSGSTTPSSSMPSNQNVPNEVTGTGAERVKNATKVYGQIAMQAQRTYGVPWEVLIAQMQVESQTGQSDVARSANNWLGITGSGNAGSYGRYAKFTNVESSIQAWAGPKVMRNGMYDEAFQYLDPNNWNLHEYLVKMISVYAPASDGNDEAGYVANIESIIETMVKPAREEMGWPSSEELAKSENIGIGGQNSLGSSVSDQMTAVSQCSTVTGAGGAGGGGSINDVALALSWPDRSHSPDDPKPEYKNALASTGIIGLGDSCSDVGKSCDAFVATVMRYSGADPEFPCCGAANQMDYLASHPDKYQHLGSGLPADQLQPGDIRVSSGHIEMYVVDGGVGKIASASHCNRTGDHGSNYYENTFEVYRKL